MKNVLRLAQPIKLVIFDVDGVLTDGSLFFTEDGIEIKAFHTHDGLGIQLLQQTGIKVAIITARHSKIVQTRMDSLGVKYIYQGNINKISAYEDILKKLNLSKEQVAYVGDDLTDLALIRRSHLGIAVINAPIFIQQQADWITTKSGGQGAAREVCELIMEAQGTLNDIYNHYL